MKRFFYLFCIALLVLPFFQSTNAVHANPSNQIGAVIENDLKEKLTSTTEKLQVIVTFKGEGPPTTQQIQLIESLGIGKGLTFESLPMAGLEATPSQILSLAKSDQVLSIYSNKKLDYYNADATELTGVDQARKDRSFQEANGGFPLTGKGVGVVVNDSGVDGTHKDHEFGKNLVQNVMGTTNLSSLAPGLLPVTYLENVANTDTNSGHGTHVAGTVGGTGAMSNGKYEGVAPGADLIGYGSGAALFILDALGGFDYAITNQSRYNIRVITNSWGSSGDFDPYNPVNIASKKAYDRGITVLFAAGNEGPGENTHNPYAKAPWVISVGAGTKDGKLADFSSRGTKGVGGTFEIDGENWTWKDEPTIVAPGVDIISTRALAPVSSLSVDYDIENIEPAYVPFYASMSGTSMATPHVAGIVAMMLEAEPTLSPEEIKEILQMTATNMPGYETWEVGAGYVNAYAALDHIINGTKYGMTLNSEQTFHSSVDVQTDVEDFTVNYDPIALTSNEDTFVVEEGVSSLIAEVNAFGLVGVEGNTLNLVLTSPDGTEYSSGVYVLFPLYTDRVVAVSNPMPGEWKVELRGLQGVEGNPLPIGLPETVNGTISQTKISNYTGLNDIHGHPAEGAILLGVHDYLFDGYSNGTFKPDQYLKRSELARYLVMGAEIRQWLPKNGPTFTDVSVDDSPFVEAVTAKGAALLSGGYAQKGVMLNKADGKFAPKDEVTRAELAYSFVQSLGLEGEAKNFAGELTVQYGDQRVPIQDGGTIPEELKGYVQLALDLNLINAYFSVQQGPYDLKPTIIASFKGTDKVKRGDFAVAMTRFYHAYLN